MKRRSSEIGIVVTTIAISSLISSCNSKVNQCKNTIQVVNQTVIDTQKLTGQGTQGDPAIIEKTAQRHEQAAKDLEAVNVDDEKLKTYKNQFITMYKSSSQVAKQIAESLKAKKSTQVLRGLNQWQMLVSPEKDLVNGINQYCKAADK
jgi:hypothetical protein